MVDDGIVVTENIFKKIEAGMEKHRAAKEGSEEIYFAVISTSITLAVVFLPIVFLQGFYGQAVSRVWYCSSGCGSYLCFRILITNTRT